MSLLFGSAVCLSMVPESDPRPLSRRMSAPGLTPEAQLRYLLQWFGEFSELQREDFLPVLAAARGDRPDQLAATLAGLSCQDKPVSLFQCRIKLFNEWYPTWTEEDQDRLVKGVCELDPEFGAKLQEVLTKGPQINGEEKVTDEHSLGDSNEPWGNGDHGEDIANGANSEAVPQDNIPLEIAAAS